MKMLSVKTIGTCASVLCLLSAFLVPVAATAAMNEDIHNENSVKPDTQRMTDLTRAVTRRNGEQDPGAIRIKADQIARLRDGSGDRALSKEASKDLSLKIQKNLEENREVSAFDPANPEFFEYLRHSAALIKAYNQGASLDLGNSDGIHRELQFTLRTSAPVPSGLFEENPQRVSDTNLVIFGSDEGPKIQGLPASMDKSGRFTGGIYYDSMDKTLPVGGAFNDPSRPRRLYLNITFKDGVIVSAALVAAYDVTDRGRQVSLSTTYVFNRNLEFIDMHTDALSSDGVRVVEPRLAKIAGLPLNVADMNEQFRKNFGLPAGAPVKLDLRVILPRVLAFQEAYKIHDLRDLTVPIP